MITIETILAVTATLLIISIIASKASGRAGVPALLIFMIVGMLAGSEGIGGIHFDNPMQAQYIGVVALVFILFSGGLETEWNSVRSVLWEGLSLATFGVLLTALALAWFITYFLGFSLTEGLLLGSIVSSTDAAAVFSVLRSKKVSLKGNLRPLLELESGSNDPMAVFLTVGFIGLIVTPQRSALSMLPVFAVQMALGMLIGYSFGRGTVYLINRIKLEYDGLYPVLTIAGVLFIYSVAAKIGGNGFLSVYIAGLVIGNSNLFQKRYLVHFHGGLAWLMQIGMFLTLGLLVFPSRLIQVAAAGVLTSIFLMFVARPLGIMITLLPFPYSLREKTLISWVGLRGSVPIILATFPLLAGIERAEMIFNIVFFIVLTSALVQGTTIPAVAKYLKVFAPLADKKKYPLEFNQSDDLNTRLIDFTVPYDSWMSGKAVSEFGLPPDSLITLIARNEDFIVPGGKTVIEPGDVLLILVNNNNLVQVQETLSRSFSR